MLVLAAYDGERTTITTPSGEEIVVTALRRQGNQTVLGFEAPDNVHILRQDLRRRIKRDLDHTPIYTLTSANHPTEVIVETDSENAERYYRHLYPDATQISIKGVNNRYLQSWYPRLKNHWLRGQQLPICISRMEE